LLFLVIHKKTPYFDVNQILLRNVPGDGGLRTTG
jgi:hypothetical protein